MNDALNDSGQTESFCRYDSDCDDGYVCQEAQCVIPQSIAEPDNKPIAGLATSLPLGIPYDQYLDEGIHEIEVDEESTIAVYTMDECGNVYDEQNTLIWGDGQCEVQGEIGMTTTVTTATNPNEIIQEDSQVDTTRAIVHTDALIRPQLGSPIRYGLFALTVVQTIVAIVLLWRAYHRVH